MSKYRNHPSMQPGHVASELDRLEDRIGVLGQRIALLEGALDEYQELHFQLIEALKLSKHPHSESLRRGLYAAQDRARVAMGNGA